MASKNEEIIYGSLQSIEEWAIAGISEKEMAEMLGMAYSTFREQKKRIPALSALLKKCADFRKQEEKKQVEPVEPSLFKRCMGYIAKLNEHIKVKQNVLDEHGEILTVGGKIVTEEKLVEVEEEQHVPADVTAIKFLLLNKAKKDWKNDPERLAIEKKRLANDTKRTKIAEDNASGQGGEGKTVEDILEAAERAAESTAANLQENGDADV